MANVSVSTNNIAVMYAARVIAQVEKYEVMRPLIGKAGDENTFVYMAPKEFRKGATCRVPLGRSVTTAALEDGATYEAQGQKVLTSESDITLNERGQVFGGFHTHEERQTVINLREMHTRDAERWWAQDFDGKCVSQMALATTSLPAKADRSTSQYNVEYCGDGEEWDTLNDSHKITAQDISRAKLYFMQRGIRPAEIGPGYYGFILFLPGEACFDLQWQGDYQTALQSALPRSDDHIFFKGHGLNPWGYIDGVYIIEDVRPVYGGTDFTFLNTETVEEQNIIKFEGIFLGAQGLAFHEWEPVTWFERIYDHGRAYEVSVHGSWGIVKTVLDRSATINGGTDRDYGLGYLCGAATAVS